jgi:hypothetical protein
MDRTSVIDMYLEVYNNTCIIVKSFNYIKITKIVRLTYFQEKTTVALYVTYYVRSTHFLAPARNLYNMQ